MQVLFFLVLWLEVWHKFKAVAKVCLSKMQVLVVGVVCSSSSGSDLGRTGITADLQSSFI